MLILFFAVITLALIFFCTTAGAALLAIPVDRMRQIMEEGGRDAARIQYWITHSQPISWSLRVAGRIFSIAFALLLAKFIAGGPMSASAVFYAFLIASFIIALPGSLIPLAWGQKGAERVGLKFIPAIRFLAVLIAPFSRFFQAMLNGMMVLIKKAPVKFKPLSLKGELDQIIGGEGAPVKLDEEEKYMIRHIFTFGDKMAKEIMTPRVSMQCLAEDDSVADALRLISREHYSRIPVYREDPDSVVGILYARDILSGRSPEESERVRVGELMREPLFVPETKKLDDLFSELRGKRIHMAVVVDEYGCTTGIVTMEDILEEIVGEIQDEYDADEGQMLQKVGDNVYRVDGRFSVGDANEELGMSIPDTEGYDTLAGFVCSLFGRVPAAGESTLWKGYEISVLDASRRGIDRLEIKKPVS